MKDCSEFTLIYMAINKPHPLKLLSIGRERGGVDRVLSSICGSGSIEGTFKTSSECTEEDWLALIRFSPPPPPLYGLEILDMKLP